MRLSRSFALMACLAAAAPALHAQTSSSPAPGLPPAMQDSLLDRFVGIWTSTRVSPRGTAVSTVQVNWILGHQFLQLHYVDNAMPGGYEAIVFIGYDAVSERYVAHWFDILGGRFSETLGYGTRVPNGIRFVFEYPDGPFVNTYTFDADRREWLSAMRQKNPAGAWVTFADETFRRATRKP